MKKWQEYEIKMLSSLEGDIEKEYVLNLFPNRSLLSIIKKRKEKKLKWRLKSHHHNEWSLEEDEILLQNYENITKENHKQYLPKRDYVNIIQRLNLNGIFKRNKKWSQKETKLLKEMYYDYEKEEILQTLKNRSWDSIKLKAEKLNLQRSHDFSRKNQVKKLLEDTNESFYWIGFILADGHIGNNRLKISLSNKDEKHLKVFCKFIENTYTIDNNTCQISTTAKDINKIPLIQNKFDIRNNKTYSPPNIKTYEKFDKKNLLSLIIGFIDGDGCISKQTGRKDSKLTIKCHSSWLQNIIWIENFIYDYFNFEKNKTLSKLNKQGYVNVNITNNKVLKQLKKEVLKLDIPFLERKWDIIDENYIGRKIINERKIIDEYKNRNKTKIIAKSNNISTATLYKILRKNNLLQ